MSKSDNAIVEQMVSEAIEQVAKNGLKGSTEKEVTLAAVGMFSRQLGNHLSSIKTSLYWLAGIIGVGIVLYTIIILLGLN